MILSSLPSSRSGAEVARLQAEVQELSQAIRQLNARLDEQHHAQR